jgi:hypothetical protein
MQEGHFEAEIVQRSSAPISWSVESLDTDGDGGVDVTIFSGPCAHDRAIEYAAWKYGAYTEEKVPLTA